MAAAHGGVERLGPLGVDEGHRPLHQPVRLDEGLVLVAEHVDEGVADAHHVEGRPSGWPGRRRSRGPRLQGRSVTASDRTTRAALERCVTWHGAADAPSSLAPWPTRIACRARSSRGGTPSRSPPTSRPRPSRARSTSTSTWPRPPARSCSTPSSSRSTRPGSSAAATVGHATVTLDDETERATLTLDDELPPGDAVVSLRFRGLLNDKLRGFYRSTFTDDARRRAGDRHHPVRGHRRPAGVPLLGRARPQGPVRHHARTSTRTSTRCRTPPSCPTSCVDGQRRVRFAETMTMSTYLVAFIVGPLEVTEPVDVAGTPAAAPLPARASSTSPPSGWRSPSSRCATSPTTSTSPTPATRWTSWPSPTSRSAPWRTSAASPSARRCSSPTPSTPRRASCRTSSTSSPTSSPTCGSATW